MTSVEEGLLVGTWRLVSFVTTDGQGGVRQYWDDRTSGVIIYTPAGLVSAQLYDARRPRLGTAWDRASASAAHAAFIGMASYCGRYSVDAVRSTVTHVIEGAVRGGDRVASGRAVLSGDAARGRVAIHAGVGSPRR